MFLGEIKCDKSQFPAKGQLLIYPLFKNVFEKDKNFQLLNRKTNGKIEKKIKVNGFKGEEGELLTLELNDFYQEIFLIGLGEEKNFSLALYRDILFSAFLLAQNKKVTQVNTFYFSYLGKNFFDLGKELALAFYSANYYFDKYKSEKERRKNVRLENLNFIFEKNVIFNQAKKDIQNGLKAGQLITQGIYLTRDLINEPANNLHPQTLVEWAFQIEKESQGLIKVEVLDADECRRLGMGAYLAVSQGSDQPPKFIILKYQDKKTNNKKICLIGKSITFDSGGLSLKPAQAMETMKIDMAGGATVLGVFKIIAQAKKYAIEINTDVYGILPACENMPSGKAIKPGDVVSSMNGKTIEILNTDAEGRLTLADALTFAQRKLNCHLIIDLATLTGACMVALGKKVAGMWGNNDDLNKKLISIAQKEKEPLWLMPLYRLYEKDLKSEIADLKNVTGSHWGGAITASLFLKEFVEEKTKWVHFDIAGISFNEEKEFAFYKKGATGWGVLLLTEFLKSF